MRIQIVLSFLLLCLMFIACEKDEFLIKEENSTRQQTFNPDDYHSGYMRIRISDALAKELEASVNPDERITGVGVKSVESALLELGTEYLTRTFPPAGRFEARTRAEGLHLWYDVHFQEATPLAKSKSILSAIEGVEIAEHVPKIKRVGGGEIIRLEGSPEPRSGGLPFDDPMLPQQWHYYNDGSLSNSVAGADINVIPVWESYTTGSSDVIVSIVDSGIDFEHEDLAANIWINEAEYHGNTGVDDDGNGFVDDIRGFNFVRNTGRIIPGNHGTHVAGTIGAVNNNGIGVSGIAGGDHARGIDGVRLMSCQIFEGDESSGRVAAAIKYGADNGAVISQNSWGYVSATSTPASDKAAIDYFIKYAGLDENGVQVGPMMGGIVIFAAGNSNTDVGHPAQYESVLSVASLAQDYRRAYYSNYGEWVDIAAPGGDAQKGGMVISTIVGDGYGGMQGTSMACPHVSGVAALVIAHSGGSGFTSEMLWDRLVSNTTSIAAYNGAMAERLGSGLTNAHAAIASASTTPPDPVTYFEGSAFSNYIYLEWEVPSDEEDHKPYGFTVYYSTSSLDDFDRTNLEGVSTASFLTKEREPGDLMQATISSLEFEANYHLVIDAYDLASNRSDLSSVISVSTLSNASPIITPLDGTSASLRAYQKKSLRFEYADPDNHPMTWEFTPGSPAASIVKINSTLQVSIVGKDAPAGDYQASLRVTDIHGAYDEVTIGYAIAQNQPPYVVSEMDDIMLGAVGRQMVFDLYDFFADDDGEPLNFSIHSSSPSVAHVNPSSGKLFITATNFGMTSVTVTAKDVMEESCSISFRILVRDENQEVDIYPNPVYDVVNLRMGKETNAQVLIINSSGAKVFEGALNIAPFAPAQIDVSNLSGGVYSLFVRYDNKELNYNIVKL